ncbi:hypothetical protein HK405_001203 [Cladochytrium tenue]|nr:hypothetical protein HK405_001203 [Cladochytrium tenue]
MTRTLCPSSAASVARAALLDGSVTAGDHWVTLRGRIYDVAPALAVHAELAGFVDGAYSATTVAAAASAARDITPGFPSFSAACGRAATASVNLTCAVDGAAAAAHCHSLAGIATALDLLYVAQVTFDWTEVSAAADLTVVGDTVLNVSSYLTWRNAGGAAFLGETADSVITDHLAVDASRAAASLSIDARQCLIDMYAFGVLARATPGCIAADIVLYASLVIILAIVGVRFVLALLFTWVISKRLGHRPSQTRKKSNTDVTFPAGPPPAGPPPPEGATTPSAAALAAAEILAGGSTRGTLRRAIQQQLRTSTNNTPESSPPGTPPMPRHATAAIEDNARSLAVTSTPVPPQLGRTSSFDPASQLLHTAILVTCYSEGEASLRTTFDSLRSTAYSSRHKLLLVVCDGIVTGAGNPRNTPDTVLAMLHPDPRWPTNPEPVGYAAVGSGPMRQNRARVYVGTYRGGGGGGADNDDNADPRLPPLRTVVVVKCGTEAEAAAAATTPGAKPGNRGKRDSQVLVMGFFGRVQQSRVGTRLDYELARAVAIAGTSDSVSDGGCRDVVSGGSDGGAASAGRYELLLMVDADTRVDRESLARMVAAMAADARIMGLCGETRIANKTESWVSRIQVFEYYLSHHLTKAFESVFGVVTCLPGCFCMYRLKGRRLASSSTTAAVAHGAAEAGGPPDDDDDEWVPLLTNPDVVTTYSRADVRTLHQKNLLLLGEDRFLTTVMLREFPRRRLVFVPSAFCKTTVPAEFRVLLSQRRRWINSTVHNLLELVLLRQLCGAFCCSMQFVILLEIVGTVTLPAAIVFTFVLIVSAIVGPAVPVIPLLMLAAILGLPAVLILLTTRRVVYVYWMLVYLLALPIWNLVLPAYAFWHFDDFSWGQTRPVEGETAALARAGHSSGDDEKKPGGAAKGEGGSVAETPTAGHALDALRRWEEWDEEFWAAKKAAAAARLKEMEERGTGDLADMARG